MARIPTIADLSGAGSLQSGRPIATVDTTAVGKGLEQAGQGVQNLGFQLGRVVGQYKQQENLADGTVADAGFNKALGDLHRTITNDGDYATQTQRFDKAVPDLIKQYGGSIRDPHARSIWEADANKASVGVRNAVATSADNGVRAGNVVKFDTGLDTYRNTIADPTVSDAERDRAKANALAAIDMGEKSGQFTPEEAQARRQTYIRGGVFSLRQAQVTTRDGNAATIPPGQVGAVNPSVPPVGRALLDTIAGTESPNYNTRYGGSTFNSFADHPRAGALITSGPNKGKTSAAAGRYQFLPATWGAEAQKLGLKDFSPANQDAAAWDLAQTTYREKTGGDLEQALQSSNAATVANVGKVLSGQWTSLPGGIEAGTNADKFAKAFGTNVSRYGDQPAQRDRQPLDKSQVAAPANSVPRDDYGTAYHNLRMQNPDLTPEQIDSLSRLAVASKNNFSSEDKQQAAAQDMVRKTQVDQLQYGARNGQVDDSQIEQGWQSGQFKTYEEYNSVRTARNQYLEERNKGAGAVEQVFSGTGQFNQFDEKSKTVADNAFQEIVRSHPDQAIQAVDAIQKRTGIVPATAANGLRGAIFWTNPEQATAALGIMSNLLTRDPNAFKGVTGGDDLANTAVKFQHYLDVGMSTDTATRRIIDENAPAYKNKIRVAEPEVKAFTDGITASTLSTAYNGSPWTSWVPVVGAGKPQVGMSPEQQNGIIADFRETAGDFYKQSGDASLAMAQAKAQLDKVYGVTSVFGTQAVVKFPIEKTYPPISGDTQGGYGYVLRQASKDIQAITGQYAQAGDITFLPIPGQTESAFAAGKPVPYMLSYKTTINGQPTWQVMYDKPWVADVSEGQRAQSLQNQMRLEGGQQQTIKVEDNFAKAQAEQDARARMNTAPTPQMAVPSPPTTPQQDIAKQMQDVSKAGPGDVPALGVGIATDWPGN